MILKTPLNLQHNELNAKMIDFHGWSMPLHYGSQVQEHREVRTNAGLFDVSHMNLIDLIGSESQAFLRLILTQDIDTISRPGHALYSCMCNHSGGIIDDLIVYHLGPNQYRLVLNSATKLTDLTWLRQQIQNFDARFIERNDLAMIAVQGPKAIAKTLTVLSLKDAQKVNDIAPYACIQLQDLFFARTGYSGEDGLEIIAPPEQIILIWEKLIQAKVKPCGLGARDTLRIEAGFLLYGQDMNETTTPLESGLQWTVNYNDANRDFIGRAAILLQKKLGVQQKLVGLHLLDKAVMRNGQTIIMKGLPNGMITSGTFSPTLNHSIAFARVPYQANGKVELKIRDKIYQADIGKLRFIQKGKSL